MFQLSFFDNMYNQCIRNILDLPRSAKKIIKEVLHAIQQDRSRCRSRWYPSSSKKINKEMLQVTQKDHPRDIEAHPQIWPRNHITQESPPEIFKVIQHLRNASSHQGRSFRRCFRSPKKITYFRPPKNIIQEVRKISKANELRNTPGHPRRSFKGILLQATSKDHPADKPHHPRRSTKDYPKPKFQSKHRWVDKPYTK